jgi:hypothetical protein
LYLAVDKIGATMDFLPTAMRNSKAAPRFYAAGARKLAVIMHRMWADGSDFRWNRNDTVAAATAV